MERKTDVLVVGGGSTGTSIFYNLAKRGATNSILIERGEQVASGQTSRSTALVRTHYSDETVARMALWSFKFFQKFPEEVNGESCGFTETGMLICADHSFEKGLHENIEMFKRIGIQSSIIDRDEARRIEPELDASLVLRDYLRTSIWVCGTVADSRIFCQSGAVKGSLKFSRIRNSSKSQSKVEATK